jgi:hypothetical protein
MNTRAGGRLATRKGSVAHMKREIEIRRRAGMDRRCRIGAEAAHGRERSQAIVAVHEVEQIRRPDNRKRRRCD